MFTNTTIIAKTTASASLIGVLLLMSTTSSMAQTVDADNANQSAPSTTAEQPILNMIRDENGKLVKSTARKPSAQATSTQLDASADASSSTLGESANNALLPHHSPRPGDVNYDGAVNVDDMLQLLSQWGVCKDGRCQSSDIAPEDGDGLIDVQDLMIVFMNWGA